ncbi:MAG: hypothetical protein C4518_04515 [Desulfobacteraceae bacterium]|nr:MAG: hypothetical protein C4518_04515 [Desulfobacteraceae bacterium]
MKIVLFIKKFKDEEPATSIINRLIDLEAAAPGELYRVMGYIDGCLSEALTKKETGCEIIPFPKNT